MVFRSSHLSLALSVVALAFAGVAIYRNTYKAMIINKGNVSPDFGLLKSGILTLNNRDKNSNKYLSQQLTQEACVFSAVQGVVNNSIDAEPRMGASLIRLHFHDCFVDLGGQTYNVALGRRDARTANFNGSSTQLPAPFDNLTVQIQKFSDKNFTVREMVALAGAQTVGFARCAIVCTSASVNPVAQLQCNCSATLTDSNLQQLDTTPAVFDNVYYNDLNKNQGILFSDQVLTRNTTTAAIVTTYSNDTNIFLGDFAAAMIKMGNLPPLAGAQLEIRDVCSRVNPTSVASM